MRSLKLLILTVIVTSVYSTRLKRETSLISEKCRQVGCERQACPLRKRWDPIKCECTCRKQFKCHPIDSVFNPDTCTYCRRQVCAENKDFDWNSCDCKCKNVEPAGGCGPDREWSNVSCACEEVVECTTPSEETTTTTDECTEETTTTEECTESTTTTEESTTTTEESTTTHVCTDDSTTEEPTTTTEEPTTEEPTTTTEEPTTEEPTTTTTEYTEPPTTEEPTTTTEEPTTEEPTTTTEEPTTTLCDETLQSKLDDLIVMMEQDFVAQDQFSLRYYDITPDASLAAGTPEVSLQILKIQMDGYKTLIANITSSLTNQPVDLILQVMSGVEQNPPAPLDCILVQLQTAEQIIDSRYNEAYNQLSGIQKYERNTTGFTCEELGAVLQVYDASVTVTMTVLSDSFASQLKIFSLYPINIADYQLNIIEQISNDAIMTSIMADLLNVPGRDYAALLDDSQTPPDSVACFRQHAQDLNNYKWSVYNQMIENAKNFANPTETTTVTTTEAFCDPLLRDQLSEILGMLDQTLVGRRELYNGYYLDRNISNGAVSALVSFSPRAMMGVFAEEISPYKNLVANITASLTNEPADLILQVILGVEQNPPAPLDCIKVQLQTAGQMIDNTYNELMQGIIDRERSFQGFSNMTCEDAAALFTEMQNAFFVIMVSNFSDFYARQSEIFTSKYASFVFDYAKVSLDKFLSGELLVILMSEFLNITESDYQSLLNDSLTPPDNIACLKLIAQDQMKFNYIGVKFVYDSVESFANSTSTQVPTETTTTEEVTTAVETTTEVPQCDLLLQDQLDDLLLILEQDLNAKQQVYLGYFNYAPEVSIARGAPEVFLDVLGREMRPIKNLIANITSSLTNQSVDIVLQVMSGVEQNPPAPLDCITVQLQTAGQMIDNKYNEIYDELHALPKYERDTTGLTCDDLLIIFQDYNINLFQLMGILNQSYANQLILFSNYSNFIDDYQIFVIERIAEDSLLIRAMADLLNVPESDYAILFDILQTPPDQIACLGPDAREQNTQKWNIFYEMINGARNFQNSTTVLTESTTTEETTTETTTDAPTESTTTEETSTTNEETTTEAPIETTTTEEVTSETTTEETTTEKTTEETSTTTEETTTEVSCDPILQDQMTEIVGMLEQVLKLKKTQYVDEYLKDPNALVRYSPRISFIAINDEIMPYRELIANITSSLTNQPADLILQVILGVEQNPPAPLDCIKVQLQNAGQMIENLINQTDDLLNITKLTQDFSGYTCEEIATKFREMTNTFYVNYIASYVKFYDLQSSIFTFKYAHFVVDYNRIAMANFFNGYAPIIMMSDYLNITEEEFRAFLNDSITPPSGLECLKQPILDMRNINGTQKAWFNAYYFAYPTTPAPTTETTTEEPTTTVEETTTEEPTNTTEETTTEASTTTTEEITTTTEEVTTTTKAPPACAFQTTIGNKIACAVHEGQTAADASSRCEALSGQLFMIESTDERSALEQWVDSLWAGRISSNLVYRINGVKSSGQWIASDGNPLSSAANPARDSGNCLLISGDDLLAQFLITSYNCEILWSYICEIPTEPSTTTTEETTTTTEEVTTEEPTTTTEETTTEETTEITTTTQDTTTPASLEGYCIDVTIITDSNGNSRFACLINQDLTSEDAYTFAIDHGFVGLYEVRTQEDLAGLTQFYANTAELIVSGYLNVDGVWVYHGTGQEMVSIAVPVDQTNDCLLLVNNMGELLTVSSPCATAKWFVVEIPVPVDTTTTDASTTTVETTTEETTGTTTVEETTTTAALCVDTLQMDSILEMDVPLKSCDGSWTLYIRDVGNVVLFETANQLNIVWSLPGPGENLVMGVDGTLSLVDISFVPIWQSSHSGPSGSYLKVLNGEIVITDDSNTIYWSSKWQSTTTEATTTEATTVGPTALETLSAGQSKTSSDGSTILTLQTDGDLVLSDGSTTIWSAGTASSVGAKYQLIMQSDGYLIILDSYGQIVWQRPSAPTNPVPGSQLYVSNGEFGIVDGSGAIIWSSASETVTTVADTTTTEEITTTAGPTALETLSAGQSKTSSDGSTILTLQTDGDLVLSDGLTTIWSAGTASPVGAKYQLIMQSDGYLIILDSYGQIVWQRPSAPTNPVPGSELYVSNGEFGIVDGSGAIIWSSASETVTTVATTTAEDTTTTAACVDTLPMDTPLNLGQSITSCDGTWTLTLDDLGSLSLYETANPSNIVWFVPGPSQNLIVGLDGSLGLYDDNYNSVWQSGSSGSSGSYLQVINGAVIITDGTSTYWSSAQSDTTTTQETTTTVGDTTTTVQPEVQSLNPGETLYSSDSASYLTFQTDGDLVLSDGSSIVWSTGTASTVGFSYQLIMQADGYLNIIDTSTNQIIWQRPSPPTVPIAGSNWYISNGVFYIMSGSQVVWSSASEATTTQATTEQSTTLPCFDTLPSTESLTAGNSIQSCDGLWTLSVTTTGEAKYYETNNPSNVIWSQGNVEYLYMGSDGILYAIYTEMIDGVAYEIISWQSGSSGVAGSYLQLVNGQMIITDNSGVSYWSAQSVTTQATTTAGPITVSTLNAGQSITSSDGSTSLLWGSDGNLVLSDGGSTIYWTTSFASGGSYQLVMLSDGYLNIIDTSTNQIVWQRPSPPTVPIAGSNWYISNGVFYIMSGSQVVWSSASEATTTQATTEQSTTPPCFDTLPSTESLTAGNSIQSCDGLWTLSVTTTGEAKYYETNNPSNVIWSQGNVEYLYMGSDGILYAIYTEMIDGVAYETISWQSGSSGVTGSYLQLVNGQMIITDNSGVSYWSAQSVTTTQATTTAEPIPVSTLNAGQSITSTDGLTSLLWGSDGNLVLSDGGSTIYWTTNFASGGSYQLVMLSDGYLNIIDTSTNQIVWQRPSPPTVPIAGSNWYISNGVFYIMSGSQVVWSSASETTTTQATTTAEPIPVNTLIAGQSITSTDGSTSLAWGSDGNLVLSDGGSTFYWTTSFASGGSYQLVMLSDGYLNIIDTSTNQIVWQRPSPPTVPIAGSNWVISNGVFYIMSGSQVVWSSASETTTTTQAPDNILASNTFLPLGDSRFTADGAYSLIFDGDGNLILMDTNTMNIIYQTNTGLMNADKALMTSTGRFVIIDANGFILWEADGSGPAGSYLDVRNGEFVITDGTTVYWSSLNDVATQPPTTPAPCVDYLAPDSILSKNDPPIKSCDRAWSLVIDSDGVLKLYETANPLNTVWTKSTGDKLKMGLDGILVFESAGSTVWQSVSSAPAGISYLRVLNGQVVIIDSTNTIYWSSAQNSDCMDILYPGDYLLSDGTGTLPSLFSCSGNFSLMLQTDGNLVLYDYGNYVWDASPPSPAATLRMESNGNLVLYDSSNLPVWTRSSEPGSYAWLTNDGRLILRGPFNDVLIAP